MRLQQQKIICEVHNTHIASNQAEKALKGAATAAV